MGKKWRVRLIAGLTLLLIFVLMWSLLVGGQISRDRTNAPVSIERGESGANGTAKPEVGSTPPDSAPATVQEPPFLGGAPPGTPPLSSRPRGLETLSQSPNMERLVNDLLEETAAGIKFGNIAYNTPTEMNVEDTAIVELKLSLDTAIEDLKKHIEAQGDREGARIRVSEVMEATLKGGGGFSCDISYA